MIRLALAIGGLAGLGTTLVLSRHRWFARPSLAERLGPYAGGAAHASTAPGLLSVDSFAEVVGPVAAIVGERLARWLGVDEPLADRLLRVRSPLDPSGFRVRQLTWAAVVTVVVASVVGALSPPLPVVVLGLLGAPLLAFLTLEQQLLVRSARRQERLRLELAVVAEQLGMLLSAGYSLGGALSRLARRGQGVIGEDLRVVVARAGQGVGEVAALREWATQADVDALHRLVAVLALDREAGDLGRLIAEEARAIRRDVQRRLVEQIERRSQQVWIPVTVSALVPGAIVIAIPFFDALRAFGAS